MLLVLYALVTPPGSSGKFQFSAYTMALVKLSRSQNRTKSQGSGAGTYREEEGVVDKGKQKTERMTEGDQNTPYVGSKSVKELT